MNPKTYIKPSEIMKSWTIDNLIEYKLVMEDKLQRLVTDNGDQFEIQRVKNLLVVVNLELTKR